MEKEADEADEEEGVHDTDSMTAPLSRASGFARLPDEGALPTGSVPTKT